MQILNSFQKFVTSEEYKKYKFFYLRLNTVCREHFELELLSANHVTPEVKKIILFVLLRGHKFLKWIQNLHTYGQMGENRENRISPERGDTISDTLVHSSKVNLIK